MNPKKIIVIVVILIIAAVAVYFLVFNKKDDKKKADDNSNSSDNNNNTATNQPGADGGTPTGRNLGKFNKMVQPDSSNNLLVQTLQNSAKDEILGIGSSGDSVRTMQGLLNKLGAGLTVDGQFGPATQSALLKYFGLKTASVSQILKV